MTGPLSCMPPTTSQNEAFTAEVTMVMTPEPLHHVTTTDRHAPHSPVPSAILTNSWFCGKKHQKQTKSQAQQIPPCFPSINS